jgi:hypothetical protein
VNLARVGVALFVVACAKTGMIPEEVDRDPPVSAQDDRAVLYLAWADPDLSLRVLALESLLVAEPETSALGFAVAASHSPEPVIQSAAIRALARRTPSLSVSAWLRSIAENETQSSAVRGQAALAAQGAEGQREWLSAANVGNSLYAQLARHRAGAGVINWVETLATTTLPNDPELIRALSVVPGLDWAVLAERAEPEVKHDVWCAAAMAGDSVSAAVVDGRQRNDDGAADAAESWIDCPSSRALSVLRALPGATARLGLVSRGVGGVEPARAALDGEDWIDAVQALARRNDEASHAILHEWATRSDDVRREVAAVALVGRALPGDKALIESFRTDASLRTRAAAAAIRFTHSPGGSF